MTRRCWLGSGLVVVLLAIVTTVWVAPVVAGPVVECGPLDQATCEEMWPLFVARAQPEGQFYWLPVTRVKIGMSSPDECGTWRVERWILMSVSHNDC